MDDFYNEQWYDDRWTALPVVMRKLAADTICKVLSDDDQKLIRRKHDEFGHDWIHHLIDIPEEDLEMYREVGMLDEIGTTFSAHHGFGTQIRNLLRDEEYGAGIKDDDLPPAPYRDGGLYQNWDDYYVQAIEAAVGLRSVGKPDLPPPPPAPGPLEPPKIPSYRKRACRPWWRFW